MARPGSRLHVLLRFLQTLGLRWRHLSLLRCDPLEDFDQPLLRLDVRLNQLPGFGLLRFVGKEELPIAYTERAALGGSPVNDCRHRRHLIGLSRIEAVVYPVHLGSSSGKRGECSVLVSVARRTCLEERLLTRVVGLQGRLALSQKRAVGRQLRPNVPASRLGRDAQGRFQ